MKLFISTTIPSHYKKIMEGFDLKLFKALKPPLMALDVVRFDGCNVGDEVHLNVGLGPFKTKWVSLITDNQENENETYFVDEGKHLPFPLKSWKHIHRVVKNDEEASEIQDNIEYSTGNRALDVLMYPVLYFQFAARKPVYKKFFS